LAVLSVWKVAVGGGHSDTKKLSLNLNTKEKSTLVRRRSVRLIGIKGVNSEVDAAQAAFEKSLILGDIRESSFQVDRFGVL